MQHESKNKAYQRIAPLDLARFERPRIDGNPGLICQAAWYVVNALVFQGAIFGLLPSRAKALVLRAFGAKVGTGLVCKPRVSIKSPWFLEVGDHVWLGELVWIDNQCRVTIGSNVCISQGVYIFTGNHDWNDSRFTFFCKPIEIGDGAWVTAFQRIQPGTIVPPQTAMVLPSQIDPAHHAR